MPSQHNQQSTQEVFSLKVTPNRKTHRQLPFYPFFPFTPSLQADFMKDELQIKVRCVRESSSKRLLSSSRASKTELVRRSQRDYKYTQHLIITHSHMPSHQHLCFFFPPPSFPSDLSIHSRQFTVTGFYHCNNGQGCTLQLKALKYPPSQISKRSCCCVLSSLCHRCEHSNALGGKKGTTGQLEVWCLSRRLIIIFYLRGCVGSLPGSCR